MHYAKSKGRISVMVVGMKRVQKDVTVAYF
jgi:hypothetical protein